MIGGLLVDTGFFLVLRDARDQYHASAEEKKHLLDRWEVILPWPVLYETRLVDDGRYRDASRRAVVANASRGRRLSLVDTA